MIKDTKEGQTHFYNDGCGEPAHNNMEKSKEQNTYCEYSNYIKDNNKNIHFICDYCGKEMDMNEVRECSFFNISSNNYIELREEWYEYLRSIINNRDYIPEDAIDGAGDWWLSKIDELLKSQREEERLRSAKIVEELMDDSEHWQPIASRIMDRVIIGKEDLSLIKNNQHEKM